MSETNEYDLTTTTPETTATATAEPTPAPAPKAAPVPKRKATAPAGVAAAKPANGKSTQAAKPAPAPKATNGKAAPAAKGEKPASPKALAAKAAAAGKATKTKATEDPATGGERTGPKKKDGLRDAQVRILHYLARHNDAADRNDVSTGAPCDLANCVELLGSHNQEKREANDAKHYPSLLTLGYVKAKVGESATGRTTVEYQITPEGKKLAGKLPEVKARTRVASAAK